MAVTMAVTMTLKDAFTPTARRISSAVRSLSGNLNTLGSQASARSIDSSGIQAIGREAEEAREEVDDLGDALEDAGREASNLGGGSGGGVTSLISKFKGAALAAGGIAIALKAAQDVIPALAKLSDEITSSDARLGLVTDDVDALKGKLMDVASASRASYMDTADMFTRLANNAGDAFNNDQNEILAFTEQISKMMAIAGVSGQEASASMTQLTQALASGTLRGDELNSIMEQAPIITKTIADSLGVSTGEIRQLASEGKITAEIVKNAILGAANETNAAFDKMPVTWSQATTKMKNIGLMALTPLLQGISKLADFVGNHMQTLMQWGSTLSGMLSKVTENLSKHSAMFAAIGTAVGKVVTLAINGLSAIFSIYSAEIDFILTGVEKVVSAVAGGINVAIVVATSLFQTIRTGVSTSWQSIKNLGSNIKTLAEQVKNALLYALYSVTAKLEEFTNKLKGLLGMSVDTSTYDSYVAKAQSARTAMTSASYKPVGATWSSDLSKSKIKAAYAEGSDLNRFLKSSSTDTSMSINTGAYGNTALSASGDALADSAATTAQNTGRINSTLSDLKESISEITEMMERQIVNSFTSTQVNIDMSGMVNKLESDVDVDAFYSEIGTRLMDYVIAGTEGGHM